MILRQPPKYPSLGEVKKYLQIDLYAWLYELSKGVLQFSFADNFTSFRVESLAVANGGTVRVPNGFRTRLNGAIPNQRIITRQSGNGHITDGTWSESFLEVINNGPSDTVVDIVYLWDGTNNSKFPILTGV